MMIGQTLIEMNEINDEMIMVMMNCENNQWRMTTRTNGKSATSLSTQQWTDNLVTVKMQENTMKTQIT